MVKILPFGSDLQIASITLRDLVLRQPLGLKFVQSDLDAEHDSIHIGYVDDQNVIHGILILKPVDDKIVKMRQVAVHPSLQGKGIGQQLVYSSEQIASEQLGAAKMILHARDVAVPFYLKLGYDIEGDEFYEVGIRHFKMVKALQ